MWITGFVFKKQTLLLSIKVLATHLYQLKLFYFWQTYFEESQNAKIKNLEFILSMCGLFHCKIIVSYHIMENVIKRGSLAYTNKHFHANFNNLWWSICWWTPNRKERCVFSEHKRESNMLSTLFEKANKSMQCDMGLYIFKSNPIM